jgi:DNA-binding transcriptional ArsR family regulator
MANASDMFTALGDPTRRSIFERLAAGALSVGEIHRTVHVSRPAVSQHLRVLKDAQLVLDEGVGARRYYRLNPAALGTLRDYLDQFWDHALEAFKEVAEAPAVRPLSRRTPRGRRRFVTPANRSRKP